MADDRGPAHCPHCGVVEAEGGFDRDDPIGTSTVSRFRCLDCDATFAWRCFPDDPECTHGPFRYRGERFVFYFGRNTRREASRTVTSTPDRDGPATGGGRYRADLTIESYAALERFLDATSDDLIPPGDRTAVLERLSGGADIDWPCEIVFDFETEDWHSYSAAHPDEARVLEPHLVRVSTAE